MMDRPLFFKVLNVFKIRNTFLKNCENASEVDTTEQMVFLN